MTELLSSGGGGGQDTPGLNASHLRTNLAPLVVAILLGLRFAPTVESATVALVAGHGVGDGQPATKAPVGSPADIAVDSEGNLYIADPVHERIRKIGPGGVITTIAGTGAPSFGGDGEPANESALRSPASLAVAEDGTVYIADQLNHRIRAIDASGAIRTVAGNGIQGFGGDGGRAEAAQLSAPSGVALDASGALYIADTGNHRIRRVSPGGTITTIAGSGRAGAEGDGGPATEAELNRPKQIAVDRIGNIFFIDSGNSYVRQIDSSGMIIGAQIVGLIQGLEVDHQGNVYVSHGARVWRSSPDGKVTVLAGRGTSGFGGDGGPAVEAELWHPTSIAASTTGEIFVVDLRNRIVRKIDETGIISTVAGNRTIARFGDGGPAHAASYSCGDTIPGPAGILYVSDPINHRIAVIAADGTIDTYAGNGTAGFSGDGGRAREAQLFRPGRLALSAEGELHVVDRENNRIRKIDKEGMIRTVVGRGGQGFAGDGGPAIEAGLDHPVGIAFGNDGSLYVSEAGNARIRRVDPDGTIDTVAGNGHTEPAQDGVSARDAALGIPGGLAVMIDGTIVVAVPSSHTVKAILPDGSLRTVAGAGTAGFAGDGQTAKDALLNGASDVAVGPEGEVWIADAGNRKIRRVASGLVETLLEVDSDSSAAPTFTPDTVALDAASGVLYVCDARARSIFSVAF